MEPYLRHQDLETWGMSGGIQPIVPVSRVI